MSYRSSFAHGENNQSFLSQLTTQPEPDLIRLGRRQGRRPRWRPSPIQEEDIKVGQQLITTFSSVQNEKTRLRLLHDFETFLHWNQALPARLQLTGLLGQMRRAGLMEGTIQEYFKKFLPDMERGLFPGRSSNREESIWIANLHRVISKMHAACETKHAVEAHTSSLLQAIAKVHPYGKEEGAIVKVILMTGLRAIDISRMNINKIIVTEKAIGVSLSWTKGIKKRTHRRHLSFPFWFGKLKRKDLKLAYKLVRRTSKNKETLASRINRFLKKSRSKDAPRLTTYSFRRAFVQKALRVCHGDGVLAARKYTAHRNVDILLSHYQTLNNVMLGNKKNAN